MTDVPFDIGAEQRLLGLLLCDGWCSACVGSLAQDHFADPINAMIFASIMRRIPAGAEATASALAHEFEGTHDLTEVGGVGYLFSLRAAIDDDRWPVLSRQARQAARKIFLCWQRRHAIEVRELRELHYSDYLASDHWQSVRQAALQRAAFRCQLCGAAGQRLDVHHNNCERRGDERPSDVIALCRGCHARFHSTG